MYRGALTTPSNLVGKEARTMAANRRNYESLIDFCKYSEGILSRQPRRTGALRRGPAGVEGNRIGKRLTEQHGAQHCGNRTKFSGLSNSSQTRPGMDQYGFGPEASGPQSGVSAFASATALTNPDEWIKLPGIGLQYQSTGAPRTSGQQKIKLPGQHWMEFHEIIVLIDDQYGDHLVGLQNR
ncbi:hypothetical protein M405DRAFT_882312 [Rhizopogon salebrosus TDB-379]|nr:hypothetical protein M405DRAFT_882312 [Rhizopogon salebrosus TDB-379]